MQLCKNGPLYVLRVIILSLKIDFVLYNSNDFKENPHSVVYYLGLRCLQKYPFKGFKSIKG